MAGRDRIRDKAASSSLECHVQRGVDSAERQVKDDFAGTVVRIWLITTLLFVLGMFVVTVFEAALKRYPASPASAQIHRLKE